MYDPLSYETGNGYEIQRVKVIYVERYILQSLC